MSIIARVDPFNVVVTGGSSIATVMPVPGNILSCTQVIIKSPVGQTPSFTWAVTDVYNNPVDGNTATAGNAYNTFVGPPGGAEYYGPVKFTISGASADGTFSVTLLGRRI